VPEGTVIWAEEPILRVTAPIAEAQIVETYLLAVINFQTMVATKAARVVQAARGRGIIEFGTRRAHGPESGVLAARAAYIGGCMGTSNVLAGHWFSIPTYGTLAHSWIMAFEDELESFRRFLEVFPEHAILLLDTYDPMAALERMIAAGLKPAGIRLDSGNLLEKSRQVRKRLDAAGLNDVRVFATGDLNEYLIAEVISQGAPIDMFGVGTELATSKDAPTLGAIYKLVEVERDSQVFPCAKFSEEKITYPGKKQIFRFASPDGFYERDVVGRADENFPGALRLLEPVMRDGRRVRQPPPLAEVRALAAANLGHLPERYRQIAAVERFPVEYSAALHQLLEVVRQQHSPGPVPIAAAPVRRSSGRDQHGDKRT
jgi:nicotinate phosphoribosyltransferase